MGGGRAEAVLGVASPTSPATCRHKFQLPVHGSFCTRGSVPLVNVQEMGEEGITAWAAI